MTEFFLAPGGHREGQGGANGPRLVAFDALAARYAISRTIAYQLIGAGKIIGVKLGRRTLIDVQSVETFIASLPRAEGIRPRTPVPDAAGEAAPNDGGDRQVAA